MTTSQQNIYFSPLRYPGGKGILSKFIKDLLFENNIIDGTYCEIYAGGAGAALDLLISGDVKNIILNDADYHIYAFWSSILNLTDQFIEKINACNININEWEHHRNIYSNPDDHSIFEVGFSTFFLNRTNRAGILPKAGPIGGMGQNGSYKMGARFNKNNLIQRIQRIAKKRKFIELYNLDALQMMNNVIKKLESEKTLVYLDPPYFKQGMNLYLSFYEEEDHNQIADCLDSFDEYYWFASYDNVPEIRSIYRNYRTFQFDLNYSLQSSYQGKELLAFSDMLSIPNIFKLGKKTQELICI